MEHQQPDSYAFFGPEYIYRPYDKPRIQPSDYQNIPKYVNYLLTICSKDNNMCLNINSPGYKWWKKVIDQTLHLRFKPMAVDICNSCQVYQNYAQDAKDEKDEMMAERYETELKEHLAEADFGYKTNSFLIGWCHRLWRKHQTAREAEEKKEEEEKKEVEQQIEPEPEEQIEDEVQQHLLNKKKNNFANPLLILSSGTFTFGTITLGTFTFKPGTAIHITIDWDKDRNEFQRQHKKFYNKEKPQFISLNIKIEPMTEAGL